jgi:predicted amidohydrolase YtcJ
MRRLVVADRVRTASGVTGDAVLIEDGVVAAVGEAAALRDDRTEEIRHAGVIIPGLIDAHFHPIGYALDQTGLSLAGAADFDELAGRIGAAASELPAEAPVLGRGLNDETLVERRLPTRNDLDRMAPGRVVLLNRVCGHLAVASTAALEAAGVSASTPDPIGGSFDRDRSGVPTGVLRETAVAVVTQAVGDLLPAITPDQVLAALSRLPALGLTGLGAIVSSGTALWCGAGDEVATLAEMAADLPLRLSVLVSADSPAALEEAASSLDGAGRRLGFLGMKDFADGSLGAHTAAMRTPFADAPDESGTLRIDATTESLARRALDLGGRIAIHAIGDRAVSRVLDLFEELLDGGADPTQLRMEHASVTFPEDIERFAALGATASIQPAFLPSETDWLERRLGRDRMRWTYAFASLAAAGVPLAGGSDSPVETPEPLRGMAAARHRSGIVPVESLGAEAALALFTDGAARACGLPPPLQPGSPADLVVLAADPVETEPLLVEQLEVLATYVDGDEVWRHPDHSVTGRSGPPSPRRQ